MSAIPRFVEYAAVFEKAVDTDDWSLVAPYFAEDAEYEVGLGPPFTPEGQSCVRGRQRILDHFKRVFDAFDRRFATREVSLLEGPRDEEGYVWVRGRASYTSPHAPPLEFDLEELARFDGDRIARLEDRYEESAAQRLRDYAAAHGAKLGFGTPG